MGINTDKKAILTLGKIEIPLVKFKKNMIKNTNL